MFQNDDDPAYAGQVVSGRVTRTDAFDRAATPIDTRVQRKPVETQLDGPRARSLFVNLMGHYRRELARQSDNRIEQETDEEFYDNEQWTEDDKALLHARNQPAMTFNVIATTINWLLGTEKRSRTDYKVLPRRKDGLKSAERKTQLMKYLSDVNNEPFSWSRAFGDCAKVGIGWMECGVQDESEGEPIYERYETWRNVIPDSLATELDVSDGRYIFRTRWTDTDIAHSLFPNRKSVIERGASNTLELSPGLDSAGDTAMDTAEEEYANTALGAADIESSYRQRIRLIEVWFRVPTEEKYIAGGQFAGEVFDPNSDGHMSDLMHGHSSIVSKVRMRMHVAIMCEDGMLYLAKSPYRHNGFPFTPIWCYRRGRNGLPYGVVRGMRDPQSDINKRASKALHILNSSKVIMDKGAVDDLDDFEEEVARPDAIIVKNPGKHLELNADRGMEQAHLDFMSRSIMMIQQISGVTDESMGRTTNATSGKAIVARQDQGSLATATIFDNYRLAKQLHGSKKLSLIEQFMSSRKQFRITNMRGNPEFVDINDGLPENDMVRTKADYIISEEDFNSTIKQAQVGELLALMSNLAAASPQIVLATLDLVVETMDVPQRDELVKRIRQISGQSDPDADPNNPDPQEQKRQAAQAEQNAMQKRAAEAEIAGKEADAAEKKARAAKAQAETERLSAQVSEILAKTAGANVDTQVRALEAAAAILTGRQLAGVADTVLAEAGFQPGGTQPQPAPMPPGDPAAQPQPPMQQQPQPQLTPPGADPSMPPEGAL
ncbi:hypothetical protein DL1_08530 [Thioclava dalianensis]|uniref:Portal protein n=1 Tax=Thioclava dalianensis TaxID=1185766 RepID=A0A074U2C9_9RHOB|nr:hypothetical protein [Thioclava dalianensis]KEP68787.1 hypothetical protein DL1_08530 [Thioclava dalianensis]SFN49939.1 hypothetical protein SAMN05216224_10681 [Thioclava dalianensis]